MKRIAVWALVPATMMLGAPLGAQVQTLKEYHVETVETLRSKFVALAEVFPEALYDWRPMEGTRSVRDVLILVAAEGNVFPANWGLPTPAGSVEGYREESARLSASVPTKRLLIEQLGRSFDHLGQSLASMSNADRAAESRTFGRDMTVEAGITLALSDLHEHLGQLIAYARMNQIVPPWSR